MTESGPQDRSAVGSVQELKLGDFLLRLFTDPNVFLLYDRRHQNTLRNKVRSLFVDRESIDNLLRYQHQCALIANKYYGLFTRERPPYVFFPSAPHGYGNYIRGKVAEYLRIPIYVGLESRIPGFRTLGRGLGRGPALVPCNSAGEKSEYIAAAQDYIKKSELDYCSAMPDYEKQRLERNKGRYFSIKQQLEKHWSRPEYVWNAWRCWRSLNQVSCRLEDVHAPYVIFFPHYQPERTSLPEGYGFTQQALAIMALREALPSNVKVLVKEHPSTFTNQCAPFVRWPGFYTQIAEMDGVDWVSIDTDNFALIEGALATATLSGTVATESLLKGVPAILFGIMKWSDTLGQHHYRTIGDLERFLLDVLGEGFDRSAIRASVMETIFETESRYAMSIVDAKDRDRVAEVIARDLDLSSHV